ncbi:MAG: alpha/beta hydrolase [Pseudomonadota bacterium]|nr:alpha/beta hydrolase [Pseudomonadota bacterium]
MNLLLAAALLALAAPGGVAVKHDLTFEAGPRGKLDVYLPGKPAPGAPVAVFIYGGAWRSGDKGLYRFVGTTLASRGILTAIPDYRVYPQVRYPDFLRDNALAVRFVKQRACEWGGDPARLFLIGHSAGAYNVAMLALDRRWLGEVGLDPRRDVAGVVGLAGPYDFLPLRDEKLKIIFGPKDKRPDTQPINHVDGRAPPMLLLAGSKDYVVNPGNTTRLATAIQRSGGEAEARLYPGIDHDGVLTAILSPLRRRAPVLAAIEDFVTLHAAAPAPAPVAKAAA